MDLLIFFAFPTATIIISIILQKIIKNPLLVAAFVFAIFLIVAFAAFDETFLIAVLVYTIIALITAFLTCIFCNHNNGVDSTCENIADILDNMTDNNSSNNENNGCGCNRYRR